LRAIQRSDQKLRPFRTGTLVSSAETSASPSSDSTSTLRKTGFGNSCKNLWAIQRSDQKLRPFRTGTLVSSAETSASPSSPSTSTVRKTASRNSCKNLRKLVEKFEGDPTVGSKLRPFQTGTLVSSAETSVSPSSDSTSTARKTASGNSCKNLRAI
jgi:hypothetical protein